MQIWAHRGASAYAPENTMEAFLKAIECGADGIELDVQLSKDGKVVVAHDESLARVSGADGYIKDLTLEELKNLNFSKVMPEYPPTSIPTLREVLQLLSRTEMVLNIELKTGIFFYEGIEEKVIELVERYGMQDRVWYSSYNHYSLKKIKSLRPEAKCGALYSNGIYQPAEYVKSLGMEAAHPAFVNLKYPDVITECRKRGLHIHTWPVNTIPDMQTCAGLDIDALITNYPDKARIFTEQLRDGHYVFDNPFKEKKDRKFYLFGAGYLGRHFLERYKEKYCPIHILDNGRDKWGKTMNGITIQSPECIQPQDVVVISSIYYVEMISQLKQMGNDNYYVYDTKSKW